MTQQNQSVQLTKTVAKFIHVRADRLDNPWGQREFTVAYHSDGKNIYAAFAYCSLKDQFARKTGSSIALGRLNAGLAGKLDNKPDLYVGAALSNFADMHEARQALVDYAMERA